VKAWSRARGEVLWEVTLPHTVNALEVDEEKGWLLGADEGGRLLRWRLVAGQAPDTEVLGQNDHPLRSLAYAPLRQLAVAGCSDGDLMALEMQRPEKLVYFTGQHYGSVTSLAFSKGERLLASSSYDGQILSWKLDNLSLPEMALQVPAVLQNGQQIFSIGFDPSGHHLLFSDREALKARTANPAMLYRQLQHLTRQQALSEAQWEVYVGGNMERPSPVEGEEVP
jgi:hypothetical protein